VEGTTVVRHPTAFQAVSFLEQHDPSFWSYGELATVGWNDCLSLTVGHLGPGHQDEVFVASIPNGDDFPEFLKSVFKKCVFRKAHCVKCFSPMSEFETRVLNEFDESGRSSQNSYLACNCGIRFGGWTEDQRML
jgi:hypothetical protein